MNKLQTFQEFLAAQGPQISIGGFTLNLLLATFLSFILGHIYVRYGTSLSNRKMFARNFVLITMTTMLIITIVKSSLALSLGLVGALSIVRFRAAIKEPEELSYLFLSIALGLGFGADQGIITVTAFCIVCVVILLRKNRSWTDTGDNLYVTVASNNPRKASLEQIVQTLEACCSAVSLKRFDEAKEVFEGVFQVGFTDFKKLQTARTELLKLDSSMRITFLDNKGIV